MTGVSALATVGSMYMGYESMQMQKDAAKKQEEALKAAEAKQKEADFNAETERLEALAKEQTATNYASVWGVDDTLASKYADAAQKWKAGTGAMTSDEEDNPFYTRGLF